jgi:hypothetical protein
MELSKDSNPYSVMLLITAYLGISWSYTTGNIGGMFFLIFLVLVYYTLERRQYSYSSLLIGLMAIFTFFPILFGLLLLFIEDTRINRRTILLPALGVVCGIFLVSWLAYPHLFYSYLGRILGSGNPLISEEGGFYKPTLYALIADLQMSLIGRNVFIFGAIVTIILIIALFQFIRHRQNFQGSILDWFSWGVLLMFLFLPHLKPYYFTLIILPTYVLFRKATDKIKSASLVIAALFPMASTFVYRQSLISSKILNLILSYNQIIAVVLILILIEWRQIPDKV